MKPKTYDVFVEARPEACDVGVQYTIINTEDIDIANNSFSSTHSSNTSTDSYEESESQNSDSSSTSDRNLVHAKAIVYESITKIFILSNPLLFVGLPKNSMYILNIISKEATLELKHIFLTLKKIRLNHTNATLAYDFGYSESYVAKIFSKTVPILARFFKKLIVWPSKSITKKNLPISFRHRFKDVDSIIDAFEVNMEKSSDAVYQAATWSDYKSNNTAKYLISTTPSSLINFVSKGMAVVQQILLSLKIADIYKFFLAIVLF